MRTSIVVVTVIPRVVHEGIRIKLINSQIVYIGHRGVWRHDTRPWNYDELDWDEVDGIHPWIGECVPSRVTVRNRTAFKIVTASNLLIISGLAWVALERCGSLGVFVCYFLWDAASSIYRDARAILSED